MTDFRIEFRIPVGLLQKIGYIRHSGVEIRKKVWLQIGI